MRLRFVTITLLLFSAAFAALAMREHFARGGPTLPRTFASRSTQNPKAAEDSILLYEYATTHLPRGATITVVKTHSRGEDMQVKRVANGQLPWHDVVPQHLLSTPQAPDFVITLGSRLDDPRYELLYESPSGIIWKRVRW